jgi:hypothetical protein|tara:strand:+ start:2792 stop:2896 length:105 start_codon:yes stop_codon:yes gene_type:complete
LHNVASLFRQLCWEFDPKDTPELLAVDETSMVIQ